MHTIISDRNYNIEKSNPLSGYAAATNYLLADCLMINIMAKMCVVVNTI